MTANTTRRSGWDVTLVVVLSLLLLVLYVFSAGPTLWLTTDNKGNASTIWAIAYMPLLLPVQGTFLEPYLNDYLEMWDE